MPGHEIERNHAIEIVSILRANRQKVIKLVFASWTIEKTTHMHDIFAREIVFEFRENRIGVKPLHATAWNIHFAGGQIYRDFRFDIAA